MKKILVLASVASMISQFNMDNIDLLIKLGYKVHVACNFREGSSCDSRSIKELQDDLRNLNILFFQIDFSRNIRSIGSHRRAYRQVKALMSKYKYTFVHCHSPVGGVIGRIAGHKTNIKSIYTAHGFHFYKGAVLANWFLYYPIERFLSHWTDTLITINREDYHCAKKFKCKRLFYIPGVGVDIEFFKNMKIDKIQVRKKMNLPEDGFVLISVGEINKNKNHEVIIRALGEISDKKIHYCLVGQGDKTLYLQKLTQQLQIEQQVHFLGYRNDVAKLYKMADVFCFPSLREGLGLAALEAMASGLPLITSNVHGIKDYSVNELTGYCTSPVDIQGFKNAILTLLRDESLRKRMSDYNIEAAKWFDIKKVSVEMKRIYSTLQVEDEVH